jgi:hypothetical protein
MSLITPNRASGSVACAMHAAATATAQTVPHRNLIFILI